MLIRKSMCIPFTDMEEFGSGHTNLYESNGHPTWENHQHRQTLETAEALRRKIKFYFMNPVRSTWHADGNHGNLYFRSSKSPSLPSRY